MDKETVMSWFELGAPKYIYVYPCSNNNGCISDDYFMIDISPVYFFVFFLFFCYFLLKFWSKWREIIYFFPEKKTPEGDVRL